MDGSRTNTSITFPSTPSKRSPYALYTLDLAVTAGGLIVVATFPVLETIVTNQIPWDGALARSVLSFGAGVDEDRVEVTHCASGSEGLVEGVCRLDGGGSLA